MTRDLSGNTLKEALSVLSVENEATFSLSLAMSRGEKTCFLAFSTLPGMLSPCGALETAAAAENGCFTTFGHSVSDYIIIVAAYFLAC